MLNYFFKLIKSNIFIEIILNKKIFLFSFFLITTINGLLESFVIGSIMPITNILQSEEKSIQYLQSFENFTNLNIELNTFIYIFFSFLILLIILSTIFLLLSFYLTFYIGHTFTHQFQTDIFKIYLKKDLNYFNNNQIGDLTQRMLAHSEKASDALQCFFKFLKEFVIVVFIFLLLLYVSIKLTLFLILLGIIILILVYFFTKIKIFYTANLSATYQKKLYDIANEVLHMIKLIQIYWTQKFFINKFEIISDKRKKINIKNEFFTHTPAILIRNFTILMMAVLLFFIFFYMNFSNSYIGIIALYGAATYKLNTSISILSAIIAQIGRNMPSLIIVLNELGNNENEDINNLILESQNYKSINKEDIRSIVFKNINFKYKNKNFYLDDINIEIQQGDFMAIVGESGSGKSTFLNLLLGFIKPDKGEIFINDINLNKLNIINWRKSLGYVSQDNNVLHGNFASNIAFGIDNNLINDEKLQYSSKIAGLDNFINQQSGKFYTEISESGKNFSGGQNQRISIARAIYNDPKVLIFDEATSNLDNNIEEFIIDQINIINEKYKKITIIVTHKLNSLKYANKIIVFDKGKIIEKGSFDYLIKKKGYFKKLFDRSKK